MLYPEFLMAMVVRKNKERRPAPVAAKPGLLGELSADVLRTLPEPELEATCVSGRAPLAAAQDCDPSRLCALVSSR
jgi:hypothetical protein